MIFRAIFLLAIVMVLLPHEPDLGFGRPGVGASVPAALSAFVKSPDQLCHGREKVCAGGATLLDTFQSFAVRSLAQVKADIAESQRERALHSHI
jgi:hypothetical protein